MMVPSTRSLRLLLVVVSGIAVFQTVALLTWYWPGGLPDTNTSGVWIALADDFAHGDFYRPLLSELGTGGTRYMPLFFVIHGLAIKLGATPLVSGVALTLASALAMSVATYVLLRAFEISKTHAWPIALLLFGTVSLQMMLLTVRGDFLAAALNLGGIAATLEAQRRNIRPLLLLASVYFAAAFLSKLTSVFGLAAMLGWMLCQKNTRSAMTLAAVSGTFMIAGLVTANAASGGRMLESFRAVANGGMTLNSVLQGPVRFGTECIHDPLSLTLFVTALISAMALDRGTPGRCAILWVAGTTLAATLIIFLSPGTSANHLMDLQAAALLVIAVSLASDRAGKWAITGVTLFGVGMCATWLPGVPSIRKFFEREGRPQIAAVRNVFRQPGSGAGPILSENPLIPIVVNQRPIVGDWFNLRLLSQEDSKFRENIAARMRAGEFNWVVLSNWPTIFTSDAAFRHSTPNDAQLRALIARKDLPDGFGQVLMINYRVVEVRRPYIYLARRDEKGPHE